MVQVDLYRQWGGSVDSTASIKVLHQATGKFKPFEGKFELPGAPAKPAPVSDDFDPTTPENYATVMADPTLQEAWQDRLDAFFQERIVAVRNALRELGWEGRDPADARLYKGDAEAQPTFHHVGPGKNVVGWAMNELRDDPDQDA